MKTRIAGLIALVGLFATFSMIFSQTTGKKIDLSVKDKQWKPEDVVTMESASQFRVSPDGKWAIWVKSTVDKEKDGAVSNLFLTSLTLQREDPTRRPAMGARQFRLLHRGPILVASRLLHGYDKSPLLL